jgi:competence protein ComEA
MDDPSGTSASTDVSEPLRSILADGAPPSNQALVVAAASKAVPANGTSPRNNPSPIGGTEEVKTGFWLTHADQIVLALLSTIVLVLLTVYWVRVSKWNTTPVEIEHLEPRQFDFRIDVNSATWVEWNQLDGVGDALARRIVDDREQNGPFRSIDDLRRVKGIGPKTLEKLRPWLSIESAQADSSP